MKNKIILPVIVTVIVGAALFSAVPIFAQTTSTGQDSLIQKIAQKFGLKTTDVKAVFDQNKVDHQTKMQQNVDAKLNQLVKDGKITQAQKDLIVAKQKELQTARSANVGSKTNLTAAQRKTAMQTQKAALEKWAKDNSIDIKYLMGGFGGMKGGRGLK
jgi:uncharacterized protein (DUF3084 family)